MKFPNTSSNPHPTNYLSSPTTLILRHRRENLNKCSLSGLEARADLRFYTYPSDPLPDCSSYLLLKVGAPILTPADASRGIFLLDGTWRLAEKMEKQLRLPLEARSLPTCFRTAYPRRQTGCPDAEAGLASIEALYIAHWILGRPLDGLLAHYHWRDAFIELNRGNLIP